MRKSVQSSRAHEPPVVDDEPSRASTPLLGRRHLLGDSSHRLWVRLTWSARRLNLYGLAFVVSLTVLIEVAAQAGLLSRFFPPPSQMALAFVQGFFSGELARTLIATLRTFATGLTTALLLAVAMGVLLGTIRPLYDALRVIIELLRPIPSVASIPIAILILGLGENMKVAVVTYAAFWPIFFNTFYGVRGVDPVALETGRTFGLSKAWILWRITLPSALSSIATGMRISAAIALILTITVELITGGDGLGFHIAQMQRAVRVPEMYAGVILSGLLGYLINVMFVGLERRVVFWNPAFGERPGR